MARALAADPLVLLMDEPFSAVDPVVRGELHEFFLGLQRELSKTIIMITHDIDEAIKLGDRVAILRVGGKLAQVGTPQQLLDEPADAFVEGFVGRDRGYRSLSFQPASGLTLGDVQVVREAGFTGGDAPVLVVDGDARPVGWSDPGRSGSVMALGATFDPETDSLRTALDAALTSPVGLAVAVTGQSRRYAGVVDADMILHQVTQARAQIAESIAVRTHDEQVTADVAPTSPRSFRESRSGVTGRVGRTPIRGRRIVRRSGRDIGPGRPPVESVGTVGAVAAAGAAAGAWPAEDDPDATRIAGPLPEQDEDPDATRVAGPLPEQDAACAPPSSGRGSARARSQGPGPRAESEASRRSSRGRGPGRVRAAASSPRSRPTRVPADQAYAAAPGGAEPYGSEVPPVSDESSATAYDAQLARDEAAESSGSPRRRRRHPDASPRSDDEHVSTPVEDAPPRPARRLR